MKLQHLFVLTFIFVLQLHRIECQLRFSFGSVHIEQDRIPFFDGFMEFLEKYGARLNKNDIFGLTSQEKQRPNSLDEILKEHEAALMRDEIFKPTTWPEGLTQRNSDLFNDKNNEISNDNGAETKRDDIFDSTSQPERQSTLILEMNNENLNENIFNRERDVFNEPDEQVEYKPSGEDLIIHMSSMTSPQLIALHGYPAESHTIVTEDGYILTIHRIPYSKHNKNKISPKKTVLLHHGLFGSSSLWLIPGPMKGLGYILSDAGYDVWMANVRGNTYSKAHVSRNVKSFEFWNFTFHEVSQHDLPAVIDYIMEVKGPDVKINYIGHSMGTTVLFALLSTKTQYNMVLRAGFALGPVAYMTNIKSPIKQLAKHSNKLHFLMTLFGGANEFLPQNPALKWLSEHSLEQVSFDKKGKFDDVMSILFGYDDGQFNKTLLPLLLNKFSGASTKTIIHYAQEIKQSGKFQMFDNGPAGNVAAYGTKSPPEYPLHKITLPIALFSGENDWLSSVDDARNLYNQLVNPIDHYIVPLKEFNHADFLWAMDAPTVLYARLLQLLEQNVSKLDSSVDILDDILLDKANVVTEEYN